jgi:CBS domain containing-hemolysin-like protein
MLVLFTVVFLMLLSSAICSGSEAAIFSLSESKVQSLIDSGHKNGSKILKIFQHKDDYISTIVLLNNAINIMGSMFIGTMAISEFGASWLGAFSLGLTIAIILFAEIIPKALSTRKSLPIVNVMSGVLSLFTFILSPLVKIIDYISRFFINLILGSDFKADVVAESDITFLAKQGAGNRDSDIRPNEAKIITQVFELIEKRAKDIMTPRTVMTYANGSSTVGENELLAENSEHSRIIVVGETIDQLLGVILQTDLLISLKDSDKDTIILNHKKLNKKPLCFGLDTPAEVMMDCFLKTRLHLAIVKDPFGGIAGIVTLEDVLEILVGEIRDESDKVFDLQDHAKKMAKLDKKLF